MTTRRHVRQNPIYQGEDEQISYNFDWTNIGTPASATVVLKDANGTNVSGTNLSGSASIAGAVVSTPLVISLTAGTKYRLECKVTISGNVFERYVDIYAET